MRIRWNARTACVSQCVLKITLGSVFGRTDFSTDFYFWAAGFFRGFFAGFSLPVFVGKRAQKILQKNPQQNPPKFIQQKSPRTSLQKAQASKNTSVSGLRVGPSKRSSRFPLSGSLPSSASSWAGMRHAWKELPLRNLEEILISRRHPRDVFFFGQNSPQKNAKHYWGRN